MAKTTKFPAREWLLTNVGESLFSLTLEEYYFFQLLAKAYYGSDIE